MFIVLGLRSVRWIRHLLPSNDLYFHLFRLTMLETEQIKVSWIEWGSWNQKYEQILIKWLRDECNEPICYFDVEKILTLNSVLLMFLFFHKSTIKVLRCQLPRENKFYKPTPPSEDDPEVLTYKYTHASQYTYI